MNVDGVRKMIAFECDKAGGIRKWADQNKIAQGYVTLVLQGRQDPGPKFMAVLDLEKIITYRKKGKCNGK